MSQSLDPGVCITVTENKTPLQLCLEGSTVEPPQTIDIPLHSTYQTSLSTPDQPDIYHLLTPLLKETLEMKF